jgi:hypothetical protein
MSCSECSVPGAFCYVPTARLASALAAAYPDSLVVRASDHYLILNAVSVTYTGDESPTTIYRRAHKIPADFLTIESVEYGHIDAAALRKSDGSPLEATV